MLRILHLTACRKALSTQRKYCLVLLKNCQILVSDLAIKQLCHHSRGDAKVRLFLETENNSPEFSGNCAEI
jgi:hypothetical protein